MINRKQFPHVFAPYCIAFETSVGAVVFRVKDGKRQYLVIKYRNGHWEFPRGKMEDNETEHETMAREICEETGIAHVDIIPDFREVMRFSYMAHGHERSERIKDDACIFVRKKAIFYLVQAPKYCVQLSHEHQNYAWVAFRDALDLLTFDNAKNIITRAEERLRHEYDT